MQIFDTMTDAEIDEIKSGRERLMNAAQPVFTKMYEAQNPNMNQGGQGFNGGRQDYQDGGSYNQDSQGGNDDVVDGDYTEV